MSQVEEDEKKKKRLARFGQAATELSVQVSVKISIIIILIMKYLFNRKERNYELTDLEQVEHNHYYTTSAPHITASTPHIT